MAATRSSDVIEVARALTGWSFDRTPATVTSRFARDAARHRRQRSCSATRSRPAAGSRTARKCSTSSRGIRRPRITSRIKLARRLVSDEPPPALVDRAAATFMRTDGDIAEVVRTIVTSPEFFARTAFRAKVKTPFELMISARRALGARADTTTSTARFISLLGQQVFGWATPEGWPDQGDAWINSGTMYKRLKFAGDIVDGRAGLGPVERWPEWATLLPEPPERQIDGVVRVILAGRAEPATRDAMIATAKESEPSAGPSRLRSLLMIALASPEFQRR